MARLLAEYAREEIDVERVIEMLLVHDVVEIDAGDTFIYDTAARERQAEKERAARPTVSSASCRPDQAAALREPWEEFENAANARGQVRLRAGTACSRCCSNFHTQGHAWRKHGVRPRAGDGGERHHRRRRAGSFGNYARGLIEEAVRLGYLAE